MFRDVPGCSGMFRSVPECSGMFHVPGFIDAPQFCGHLVSLIVSQYIRLSPKKNFAAYN